MEIWALLLAHGVLCVGSIISVYVKLSERVAKAESALSHMRLDVDAEKSRGDEMIPRLVKMETLLDLIYKRLVKE